MLEFLKTTLEVTIGVASGIGAVLIIVCALDWLGQKRRE